MVRRHRLAFEADRWRRPRRRRPRQRLRRRRLRGEGGPRATWGPSGNEAFGKYAEAEEEEGGDEEEESRRRVLCVGYVSCY